MQSDIKKKTFSVVELNRQARRLLEMQFNQVWVTGEISNFTVPASRHWYFTLKDDAAHIRCAMFKNRNILADKTPKSGDQVLVRGKVSLYEARGDYQFIVDHVEPSGVGALQIAFDTLKRKLAAEGLFDVDHKKALPNSPETVAVISSATGAAVHDIIHVLKRRNPLIHIIILPCSVQGPDAPSELTHAIEKVQALEKRPGTQFPKIDAIIIGRGGGSLEDLWAFNDEQLARTIFACPIPIVSAVGHEIDFSISDFAADMRASTPSVAAEILSVDHSHTEAQLMRLRQKLLHLFAQKVRTLNTALTQTSKQIKHPGSQIQQWQQRLDHLDSRLSNTLFQKVNDKKLINTALQKRLRRASPLSSIENKREHVGDQCKRLKVAIKNSIQQKTLLHDSKKIALDLVSPLGILKRGYCIAKDDAGIIIKSNSEAQRKKNLSIVFHDGETHAVITNSKHS